MCQASRLKVGKQIFYFKFPTSQYFEYFLKNFWEVFKRLSGFWNRNVSFSFLAAYRKSHNTQHVLIKKIEEWRKNLDDNFLVGVVLTDLSKAFDCIPHDLLIAKLSAYGLSSDSLCYIYSYLKDRKQCVQINNKQSEFDTIISGVLGVNFWTDFV